MTNAAVAYSRREEFDKYLKSYAKPSKPTYQVKTTKHDSALALKLKEALEARRAKTEAANEEFYAKRLEDEETLLERAAAKYRIFTTTTGTATGAAAGDIRIGGDGKILTIEADQTTLQDLVIQWQRSTAATGDAQVRITKNRYRDWFPTAATTTNSVWRSYDNTTGAIYDNDLDELWVTASNSTNTITWDWETASTSISSTDPARMMQDWLKQKKYQESPEYKAKVAREAKIREIKGNLLVKTKTRQNLFGIKVTPQELKARDLLRDMISEADWRRYCTNGFLMVRGASGRWYQIFADKERIKVYENNKFIGRLCIYSDEMCPPTDHVVNMKAMIEIDEKLIWQNSNYHYYDVEPANVLRETPDGKKIRVAGDGIVPNETGNTYITIGAGTHQIVTATNPMFVTNQMLAIG